MAVGVGVHQDVRGQRGFAGGDLPDVEVVDFADTGPAGHRGTDAVRVEPVRCGLEEDPSGGAQQADTGFHHEDDDDDRGDGVGPVPSGDDYDHARYHGRDERIEIGEDVLEGAFDVQACPVGSTDRRGCGNVDGHPDQRGAQDEPTGHRAR